MPPSTAQSAVLPVETPQSAAPALTFPTFAWRVIALHAVTYFLVGAVSYFALDYHDVIAQTDLKYVMRPTDSPWVAVGPGMQAGRGLLFAVVLWPFADRLLAGLRGALALWGLFLGRAILGPSVAAPGSLEGLIYTSVPVGVQLLWLPEVVVQTGLFALALVGWCHRPARWMDVVAGIGLGVIVLMSIAGWLAGTA